MTTPVATAVDEDNDDAVATAVDDAPVARAVDNNNARGRGHGQRPRP